MAKLMLNKQPEKREMDGQESKALLQQKIRELESLTVQATQELPIEQLIILPRFRDIFPIKDEVLHAITQSMKSNGFDIHHPILLWQNHHIVVDGHTRLQAAKMVGLTHVPIAYVCFDSEDDAEQYIFSLQFHRRNLTEADRLSFLMRWLDHMGAKKLESGQKKVLLADLLNVSARTAQKYLNIAQSGKQEIREQVLNSQLSIHQADLLISHGKQAQKMLNSSLGERIQKLLHPKEPAADTQEKNKSLQSPIQKKSPSPKNDARLKQYFTKLQQQSVPEISAIVNYTQELIKALWESGALNQKDAADLLKQIALIQEQK